MLWGVIHRKNLKVYTAYKEIEAFEGTSFHIYTNLDRAIEARNRLSERNNWAVVVSLDEVKFVPLEENS